MWNLASIPPRASRHGFKLRRVWASVTSPKVLGNSLQADSHIACSDRAVPLPCHAAKGLECVFPI